MDIYIVGGIICGRELASRLRNIAKENFNPGKVNYPMARPWGITNEDNEKLCDEIFVNRVHLK